MKTLLVVTEHLDFTETICSGLKPGQWRIINPHSPEQAGPLLERGCIDSCIVDADSSKDRGRSWLRTLGQGPRVFHNPLYQFQRFGMGTRSVSGRGKLCSRQAVRRAACSRPLGSASARNLQPARNLEPWFRRPRKEPTARQNPRRRSETTHVLRGFSRMLSHSLSMEGLLRPFLHWLRDF